MVLIVLASGAGQWGSGEARDKVGIIKITARKLTKPGGQVSENVLRGTDFPASFGTRLAGSLLTQFRLGPCPFSGSENSTSVVSLLADHL